MRTWLRRLGFGRNALRRRSDVVEAVVLVLVLFGALAVVPIAASVGQAVFQQGLSAVAEESALHHETTAVLQEDAKAVSQTSADAGSTGKTSASATWLTPNGVPKSGVIEVDYGARAGQRIELWTDGNGDRVAGPRTADELRAQAITIGLLFGLGWLMLLAIGYAVFRSRLNRGRSAQWDADWLRVSETWRHTP